MLGKYINQFMADNELSVNEEFFIENMDGNRVLIGCADRYKIEDVDGGILTAAVMNEKDKPPAMLLEAALIDLLRENYLVKKKPFYPVVGEYYYYISPSGNVIYANFTGCAEDLLLCKYIGVYKTEEAAKKNVSRCLKLWEEVKRSRKLANNWQSSQEIQAKYDDCLTSGIFPSMKINTDIVNMPSYVFPIICIWVVDK